ncbi:hypothetical protein MA16_Dca027551 [Dendrobium catenatum]|uniref:Uncharacterized protein n=1 Tax=Dendrobium catenatum TaxID=906689 RepID=A0A2I0VXC4_9ASPA|nr:hypothetical protein MA16_Dca027551 [Dendrobium catenatum]
MRKRGFIPSLVSYNSIVHGLSKKRGCMRVLTCIHEPKRKKKFSYLFGAELRTSSLFKSRKSSDASFLPRRIHVVKELKKTRP